MASRASRRLAADTGPREPTQTASQAFRHTLVSGLRALTGTARAPWDEDGPQGGRPAQLPPGHPRSLYWWLPRFWFWLNLSGRGTGKTRSAVEFLFWRRRRGYGRRVALVGQTAADVRDVIVEGESGILAKSPPDDRPRYEPSKRRLTWRDGSIATCYSGDEPGQLRGPQHDTALLDEFAKYKAGKDTLSNVKLGLRLSDDPCGYITTTPVPSPEMRALVADSRRWENHLRSVTGSTAPGMETGPQLALDAGAWVRAGGDPRSLLFPGANGRREVPPVVTVSEPTDANRANLSSEFYSQVCREYDGTRLGAQELGGRLLEDVEGALWLQRTIDANRGRRFVVHEGGESRAVWMVYDRGLGLWRPVPELAWVVVGVDPAVTHSATSDETGIVVGALGEDEHAYILEDASCHESPERWARESVDAYERWGGNLVVGEVNNGGDLVEAVLRTQDRHVSYAKVHASRGKATRAEPVAAMYEQGRCHHLGTFPQMEEEMTTWVPKTGQPSPNRMDALVWTVFKLAIEAGGSWAVRTVKGGEDGEEGAVPS